MLMTRLCACTQSGTVLVAALLYTVLLLFLDLPSRQVLLLHFTTAMFHCCLQHLLLPPIEATNCDRMGD
jgi:hypothetical protein